MADRTVLGIDIGMKKTKFALVKSGRSPKVLFHGMIRTPEGCYKDGEITDGLILGNAIKTFIDDNKLKNKPISMVVNSSQSIVREIDLPAMDEKEICGAIEFQLSQSFSGVGKSHTIGYKIIENDKNGIYGIAAFCPNRVLNTYGMLAEDHKLPVKYLDDSGNCRSKGYKYFYPDSEINSNVIIVDIGADSTEVDLVDNLHLALNRHVDGGSSSIDKMIASSLNIDNDEAEQIKLNKHNEITVTDEEMQSYIRLGLIAIDEQINQTINFYTYGNESRSIERIILIGASAKLKGIEAHFKENFTQRIEVARSDLQQFNEENILLEYMSAIGAAIREK